MAPKICASMYGRTLLKLPVATANASVTAGLRWPGPPHAFAVNTPVITAKAQPVAIAIQPAFSAFDFRNNTLATTPFPMRIRIMVPMNSPNICFSIVGPYPALSSIGVQPVERSYHRLLPEAVQLVAALRIHRGL